MSTRIGEVHRCRICRSHEHNFRRCPQRAAMHQRAYDNAHRIRVMPMGFARAYHAGTDWEAWLRGTKLRLGRMGTAMLRGLARHFDDEVDDGLARCAFAELARRRELDA